MRYESGNYYDRIQARNEQELWLQPQFSPLASRFIALCCEAFLLLMDFGVYLLSVSFHKPHVVLIGFAATLTCASTFGQAPRFHYPVSDWISLEECEIAYNTTLKAYAVAYMELQDARNSFWGTPSPFGKELDERQQRADELAVILDRSKALLDARRQEEQQKEMQNKETQEKPATEESST